MTNCELGNAWSVNTSLSVEMISDGLTIVYPVSVIRLGRIARLMYMVSRLAARPCPTASARYTPVCSSSIRKTSNMSPDTQEAGRYTEANCRLWIGRRRSGRKSRCSLPASRSSWSTSRK